MCRGHKLAACIGVALSGLIAISALVIEPRERALHAALLTVSASAPLFLLRMPGALAWLAGVIAASSMSGIGGSPELGALYGGLLVALMSPVNLGAALLGAGIVPGLISLWGGLNEALLLALSACFIVYAVYAVRFTGRAHPGVIAIGAPIPLVFGPTVGSLALLPALPIVMASTGVVEKSGCPFRADPSLISAGSLITLTGVAATIIMGVSAQVMSLWALGYLLLIAGILVPFTSRGS